MSDNEKQFFAELIEVMLKENISSKKKLNLLKNELSKKYGLKRIVKNPEIIANSKPNQREKISELLNIKPVRDASGVTVVALFAKPHKCPHGKCIYCPGGVNSEFGDTPQSYTGKEPAALRAIRNDYDPYLQVFNRLEHYVINGKIPDKLELIFMGGTFPSLDKKYRDEFVYYVYKAINDFGEEFIFVDENGNKQVNSQKFNEFFLLDQKLDSLNRESEIKKKVLELKRKQKLNIGIDIDEVLAELLPEFLIYYNKRFDTNFKIEDFKSYEWWKIIGGDNISVSKLVEDFLGEGLYSNLKTIENSIYVLKELSKKHNLYVITSRYDKMKEVTLNWLNENYGDIFTEIIFAYNGYVKKGISNLSKGDFCSSYNIDFMIEDAFSYAKDCSLKGTKVLLYDWPWNRDVDLDENILRVKNWNEINGIISNFDFENNNLNSKMNFKSEILKCETSIIRPIGLTIETKPDYCKKEDLDEILEYGATRLEIGVQSLDDKILKKIGRGHGINEVIESFKIAKDMCFKINAHMMVNLPFSSKDEDINSLKNLYEDKRFRPDMMKIYPCLVVKGTMLYDLWRQGKFISMETLEIAELIADAFIYFPRYTRVMRIQRDIPTPNIDAGVKNSNLRQYVDNLLDERKIVSKDIREREIGLRSLKGFEFGKFELNIEEYDASLGKEFFIDAVDENDSMIGFCRLRFPSRYDLRVEIEKGTALIRELHVYGSTLSVGEKENVLGFQHRGWGKKLILKAEEIARENNYKKIAVISGIGVREYYKKLGYRKEGYYMIKDL